MPDTYPSKPRTGRGGRGVRAAPTPYSPNDNSSAVSMNRTV